ncbi:glycosyltransferase [Pseudoduganella violacea]|uniref:Glycosyltransferase involved in cell wall biosynthesis n=1 Tax=Pseudoduganella violacea TaxID=1715466 RepID=A0A7W5B7N2_9BURK|nr:glycosyltransferase [Pseudoduganella violacea]MBB3118066.1 glycosyltransferase involved in cell wall biosynthesis [Pseudoduganella violacea]
MRIVLDFQSWQEGTAPGRAAVLALVRALLPLLAPHTVLLACDRRHADSVDELRAAFDGLLPRAQLLAYGTPAPRGAWQEHAARELRAGFLAALNADLLLEAGRHAPGLVRASADGLRLPSAAEQQLAAAGATPEAAAAALLAALPEAPPHDDAAAPAGARPRLAFISPLPPEHSGIADYSAELIAELEAYYELSLVLTPGATPDAALQRFPQLSVADFEQQAHQFARRLYHFGNSNMHKHMFGLLQRHPGVVVLHDFYLSGVLDNMERDGDQPGAFMQALYGAHGYGALGHHREHGRNPTIWAYPCNKAVLDQADGVIVHSAFSCRLAEQWYGPGSADAWRTLPLLRGQVGAAEPAAARQAARAALGLADDAFLVCSFGMLGATKLNARLLDAFLASPLAQDAKAQLVFVGENDAGPYGRELQRQIAASPAAGRIRITGFVSGADYAHWLAASDAAVQLRAQTRGETSAAVLDCLLHGVPTIINAHGAAADLPPAVLRMLPDEFSTAALAAALQELAADPALRATLAAAGRDYIRSAHAPAAVGRQYHAAIEHFARHSPAAHYRRQLAALARPGTPRPNQAALLETATLLAANRPAPAQRQLLIDISALVQTDHKTGIQRVVRSILLALIAEPPPGYRVEPVYSEGGGHNYRYARHFMLSMLGEAGLGLEDAPIEARAGDHFLGLDLASNITTQNEELLLALRRRGVRVQFVVYDLLPLLRPDSFPYGTQKYYGDYLHTVAMVADGLVAISRAVADELEQWLAAQPNRRRAPLDLAWFHLGADLAASAPSRGMPPEADAVLAATARAPTLLMVGTVEPRKGQAQALAACEQLWAQGVAVNLVIVGKNGWLMEQFAKRMDQHPEQGKRLFWLPGVSDEMLEQLYQRCAALLAASEGEGFGLPLIEAAQHGLPILARDIPVFREVAGAHASFFTAADAAELAAAVAHWLALHAAGQAPASANLPWLTWRASARQLLAATVDGQVYRRFVPAGVAPQLLVDVSAIVRDDLKTGIQRVVRAQLSELLRTATTRYRVLPVYLTDEGGHWHYRYGRRYTHQLLGTDDSGVVDEDVQVTSGDVFYSPDFFPGAVCEAARIGLYQEWRARGVSINFLIHDLLPVLRPDFFPPKVDQVFEKWLRTVSGVADRLICISGAVAEETRAWLQRHGDGAPPQLAVVHHGADIDASRPSTGLADDAPAVLADLGAAPGFLMVGTIEPRKGHLQALDAFEQLWAEGADVRLVVVGGEGWKGVPDAQRRSIPAIMQRLSSHPELGRRLHWLRGISDEYLEQVYRASACLLAPSEGEGFGLPLIEAARHALPVIARDLPVFREVAQEHAHYFSGMAGADLAAAVRDWLQLKAQGRAASSAGMPWQTWAQNVQVLTATLFGPAYEETASHV